MGWLSKEPPPPADPQFAKWRARLRGEVSHIKATEIRLDWERKLDALDRRIQHLGPGWARAGDDLVRVAEELSLDLEAEEPGWLERNNYWFSFWTGWIPGSPLIGLETNYYLGKVAARREESRLALWREAQAAKEALRAAEAGALRVLNSAAPTGHSNPAPIVVQVNPHVVHHAAGAFRLRVHNDRFESRARVRLFGEQLRGLEAQRAVRLLDPKAQPGDAVSEQLNKAILAAREGLRNAVGEVYVDQPRAGQPPPAGSPAKRAADAAVAAAESRALPTALDTYRAKQALLTPPPAAPVPMPAPEPGTDLDALCDALLTGLIEGLRGQ